MKIESIIIEQKLNKIVKRDSKGNKYILKSDLKDLNLNHDEKKLVYETLNDEKIKIRLTSIEDNKLEKNVQSNSLMNSNFLKAQSKKFKKMKSIDCSEELRKQLRSELIVSNMGLVNYVTEKYSFLYKINVEELNSYGYEALITAVDNYDVAYGTTFSTYAVLCIRSAVIKAISYMQGFFHQTYLYSDYSIIKAEIEKEKGVSVFDDPDLYYIIVDEMKKQYNIDDKKANNLLNNLFISSVSKDGYCEDTEVEKDFTIISDLSIDLSNALSTLTSKEQLVLKYKYGFDGLGCKNLQDVAEILGVSREAVRQVDERAFSKLRQPERSAKIKGYYK